MLNLSVNLCTIMLIRLGYLDLAPNVPFLIIATISAIVSAYAIWRWLKIRKEKVQ
jgi:hypothetical protein